LADYLTLVEHFDDLSQVTLAYIGDGNNVTHSLLIIGAILGCNVTVITPAGHEVAEDVLSYAQQEAAKSGAKIMASHDMKDAQGADVLYTDTWLSMGDETPLSDIKDTFAAYQINQQLMADTGAKYVMHCQPAHRDLEITSEVIDGEQSLLLQQAENRMHAQNAILVNLLT
jgi:ornithine carbamoyltransferase